MGCWATVPPFVDASRLHRRFDHMSMCSSGGTFVYIRGLQCLNEEGICKDLHYVCFRKFLHVVGSLSLAVYVRLFNLFVQTLGLGKNSPGRKRRHMKP